MSSHTTIRCDCCREEIGKESPVGGGGFSYQLQNIRETAWMYRFDLCGECVPQWMLILEAFGAQPAWEHLGEDEKVWCEAVWTPEGRRKHAGELHALIDRIPFEDSE